MKFRIDPQSPDNHLTGEIVDAGFCIHEHFGPGLLESVYEVALAKELRDRGLRVGRQVAVPIRYKGMIFDEGFRADLIVEEKVLLELKSVEKVHPVHKKQVLTYLRMMDFRVGILINFGNHLFRDGVHRIVNGQPD